MTVETRLGDHDAKGLVHGMRRGRFPINTTLFPLGLSSLSPLAVEFAFRQSAEEQAIRAA
jgi:hypothetical protein